MDLKNKKIKEGKNPQKRTDNEKKDKCERNRVKLVEEREKRTINVSKGLRNE